MFWVPLEFFGSFNLKPESSAIITFPDSSAPSDYPDLISALHLRHCQPSSGHIGGRAIVETSISLFVDCLLKVLVIRGRWFLQAGSQQHEIHSNLGYKQEGSLEHPTGSWSLRLQCLSLAPDCVTIQSEVWCCWGWGRGALRMQDQLHPVHNCILTKGRASASCLPAQGSPGHWGLCGTFMDM